jgi:tetratricopeptide (TPR) repeat protein
VISAVLKSSTDFRICLELCHAAYEYSYQRGLYGSAFTLGQRILDLLLTLHQEKKREIAQWKYKVAFCCYRSENYLEANKLYLEALELFQKESKDVTRDVMIAKLFAEMSDINLSLNNFDAAVLHLISMSEIWFTLSSSPPPLAAPSSDTQQQEAEEEEEQEKISQLSQPQPQLSSSSKKCQREIIEFEKKMTTIEMLSKNCHQAIEFCELGLDLMVCLCAGTRLSGRGGGLVHGLVCLGDAELT